MMWRCNYNSLGSATLSPPYFIGEFFWMQRDTVQIFTLFDDESSQNDENVIINFTIVIVIHQLDHNMFVFNDNSICMAE